MIYQLRDYQKEAVDQTAKILVAHKRVLIVAATGSGKALMLSSITNRFLSKYPNKRMLILAHQSTLIKQNAEKIHSFCPENTIGIYCAELGLKETSQQIILASRDSLARNPDICGKFDACCLDECHLASAELDKPNSQYGKIFCAQDLETLLVVGLTATPWRLKGGNIWGENKFFKKVAYNIGTDYLISKGYLSPYIYPCAPKIINTDGIKKLAGDFNITELETCSIKVVESCLTEWHKYAAERKLTLFFCVGKAHAKLVAEKLEAYLDKSEILYIDGDTENKPEVIAAIQANAIIKAVVSIAVLTTGTDIPRIDCICMLRATQSVILYVQCVGRGLRLFEGKANCLILDFAGNTDRFKSIDKPFIKTSALQTAPSESQDTVLAPIKSCPECLGECAANKRVCEFCNHIFINHVANTWEKKPAQWYRVYGYSFDSDRRITKTGKEAYVIRYNTIDGLLYQWCFVGGRGINYYNNLRSTLDKNQLFAIKGDMSGKIINADQFAFLKNDKVVIVEYRYGEFKILESIDMEDME